MVYYIPHISSIAVFWDILLFGKVLVKLKKRVQKLSFFILKVCLIQFWFDPLQTSFETFIIIYNEI